ncbi:MAG TPA: EamA family transporter RarD [Opitutaceae bacterium]|nr:EamA family transporter RarD [Opitutaceae bacterium]
MPAASPQSEATRGGVAAAAGFLCWGIVPIYWKALAAVPALELIAHRVVWSLLFLLAVQAWRGRLGALRDGLATPRAIGLNLLSSVLLGANWTVYVWGVNSGHVIECSLGYFLTPLGNVALGYVFLHERLRPLQWTAIGFAAAGVLLLLLRLGHVPWIALALAGTWSSYAILKKQSQLGPMNGLTVETILLFPVAAGALVWWHFSGVGALGRVGPGDHALILSAGVITAVPLLLFAQGAQRVRLSTLGLLQYLSPSVQFGLGVFVYDEPFDAARLQAFAVIWTGLLLYTADGFWSQRRRLFA